MAECANCGDTKDIHIHHIVPRALGGTERETNKVALCCDCHAKVHGFGSGYAEAWRQGIERAKKQPRRGRRLATRLRAAEELLKQSGLVY